MLQIYRKLERKRINSRYILMQQPKLPYFDIDGGVYDFRFPMDTWYSDPFRGRTKIRSWEGTYLLGVL